jgi:hypothetical protein
MSVHCLAALSRPENSLGPPLVLPVNGPISGRDLVASDPAAP